MDFKPIRPRNISIVEVIAALLVISIWATVFLAIVAVGFAFLNGQDGTPQFVRSTQPSQIALGGSAAPPARWPMPAERSSPPLTKPAVATSTESVRVEASPTLPVALSTIEAEQRDPAAATSNLPATPAPPMALPSPAPGVPVDTATTEPLPTPPLPAVPPSTPTTAEPTVTATRVKLPTPLPDETATPIPTLPTNSKPEGVHLVSTGETLAAIAAAYGASVESLVQANRLEDASRIRVGQRLQIPIASAAVNPNPPPAAVPAPVDAPAQAVSGPIETGPLAVPPPPAGDPPQRIVIPKIKLDTKIVQVGWRVVNDGGRSVNVWEVADFAAGWHRGSAHPGNVGNTVISGHHNIKGEVFRYVVDLEEGDEIDVFVGDQRYPYRVTEKQILREKGMADDVRAANARWIAQTTDERLTLVTCWPYSSNTHRVIVVARPLWK